MIRVMTPHLRIARPVTDLARTRDMYQRGLGMQIVGHFEDHEGFDGVMLAMEGASWHFEFTRCRHHPVTPSATAEDLIALYLPDESVWKEACAKLVAAGFRPVAAFNPYWDERGRTFEDADGYRVVLECAEWQADERESSDL